MEKAGMHPSIEDVTREIGLEISHRIEGEIPSVFDPKHWETRLLEAAMDDDELRTDLLRFIDVLPALRNDGDVSRLVREYLLRDGRLIAGPLGLVLRAAGSGVAASVSGRAIRAIAGRFGSRFIAGASLEAALPSLSHMHDRSIAFSADLLGEAVVSDAEAQNYIERYMTLCRDLSRHTKTWPANARVDSNHLGPLPRANLSIKLSSFSPHLGAVDLQGSVVALMRKVLPLAVLARAEGCALTIDLEQWELHEAAYSLFEKLALEPELHGWPNIGIVIQAYLKSARADAERLLSLAERRGAPVSVRLVKGAYWDYEVVHARQNGFECPVIKGKTAVDLSFEGLSDFLLSHTDLAYTGIGSHNIRSLSHALAAARNANVPKEAFEVQMLHGMAEPARDALTEMGYRVRIYSPIGELLPGTAYLVRRLLENTANTGFLRTKYHEMAGLDSLLAPPLPGTDAQPDSRAAHVPRTGSLPAAPFINCPCADFTQPEVRSSMSTALSDRAAAAVEEVPVVVSGVVRTGGRVIERVCPSDTRRAVCHVHMATMEEADLAVREALNAWPTWRDTPLEERALLCKRLADLLLEHRWDLASLEVFEVGKTARDADADVAEAVDYCRFYAGQAVQELKPRYTMGMDGEENLLWYEGRGPAAVIAPWNFPLAILCGMTTAALVAGNTVVMKPAEQSSATAFALHGLMLSAGFPAYAVQFLPGFGEEIGSILVSDPRIAQIAFTGSKTVGLEILEHAGKTEAGQTQVKRVVCEMGGKNAIIVDEDADLDEAVAGCVTSAFGYAGQKCSACSRAIVLTGVYERFVSRLVEAVRSLIIAPANEPRAEMGPVIDADAYDRLMKVIQNPGNGTERLFIGTAPGGGFFVPPTVFAVRDAAHPLMQRELFGPILTVYRAESFDDALRASSLSEYALTGGLYSRSPSHLARAARTFRVGNLYLNRAITGAVVGRQPFGGFAMSGAGTKAGGPGYLLHFTDPRSVCENTMRRGFVPEKDPLTAALEPKKARNSTQNGRKTAPEVKK